MIAWRCYLPFWFQVAGQSTSLDCHCSYFYSFMLAPLEPHIISTYDMSWSKDSKRVFAHIYIYIFKFQNHTPNIIPSPNPTPTVSESCQPFTGAGTPRSTTAVTRTGFPKALPIILGRSNLRKPNRANCPKRPKPSPRARRTNDQIIRIWFAFAGPLTLSSSESTHAHVKLKSSVASFCWEKQFPNLLTLNHVYVLNLSSSWKINRF